METDNVAVAPPMRQWTPEDIKRAIDYYQSVGCFTDVHFTDNVLYFKSNGVECSLSSPPENM